MGSWTLWTLEVDSESHLGTIVLGVTLTPVET